MRKVRRSVKSWGTVRFKVFDADGEFKTFTFMPPKCKRYTEDAILEAAGEFMAWLAKNCPKVQFRMEQIEKNRFNLIPQESPQLPN